MAKLQDRGIGGNCQPGITGQYLAKSTATERSYDLGGSAQFLFRIGRSGSRFDVMGTKKIPTRRTCWSLEN